MSKHIQSLFESENSQREHVESSSFTTYINQNDGFIPYSMSPDPDDDHNAGNPTIPPPMFTWLDDLLVSGRNRTSAMRL